MSSKCGVCQKSVYPMDPQINLDGSIFHKTCAKCEDCKCQITLANFTKTGTTLLCKIHYFKKFNEQGTYLGGEKFAQQSGRPGSHSPPPPGTDATRAPVSSSPAVQSFVPPSASSSSVSLSTSDVPQSTGSVRDRMKMFSKNVGNQIKCAQCSRSVYANDPQIVLDGMVYHKECAKCTDCKCQITIQNFTKSGTTLYCKTHYFKKFNEEGSYLGGERFTHKTTPGGYVAKSTNFSSAEAPPPAPTSTPASPPPAPVPIPNTATSEASVVSEEAPVRGGDVPEVSEFSVDVVENDVSEEAASLTETAAIVETGAADETVAAGDTPEGGGTPTGESKEGLSGEGDGAVDSSRSATEVVDGAGSGVDAASEPVVTGGEVGESPVAAESSSCVANGEEDVEAV